MKLESDLYQPVKTFLEAQGFTVKGEVNAVDVVAVRGDEPPVVVELKLRFSLSLFHQATARMSLTDFVYVAVLHPSGKNARRSIRDNKSLCRRLGLGLVTVQKDGSVVVHCDPGPYSPRKSKVRTARLLREFGNREGDPNKGGTSRRKIVTAYRQSALKIAEYLGQNGPTKGAIVAKSVDVPAATRIMADNHYGWFVRVSPGIYQLTEAGRSEL